MNKKRKLFSLQMLMFEFRNTTGNPYVHIFGIGMPIMLAYVISRAVVSELPDELIPQVVTSIFLGIGTIIPMATVFIGYGVSQAQELEKGIPQRMELFGIPTRVTICNRVVSEVLLMLLAFCIYFVFGFAVMDLKAPVLSGALLYMASILAFVVILFCLSHAIALCLKKFGPAYCVTMLLYFVFMIFGGLMGISYENMPEGMQMVAKFLPITYINRDFYTVWIGEEYNFVPMLQAYLFFGALAGVFLFIVLKKNARKLH